MKKKIRKILSLIWIMVFVGFYIRRITLLIPEIIANDNAVQTATIEEQRTLNLNTDNKLIFGPIDKNLQKQSAIRKLRSSIIQLIVSIITLSAILAYSRKFIQDNKERKLILIWTLWRLISLAIFVVEINWRLPPLWA